MKKRIALAAAACIAAGSVILSGCATEVKATVPDVIQVQSVEGSEGTISLSTSETVKVVPDMAQIIYGIRTEDADAEKCQQDNAKKLDELLEYLKGQGVEEKSISTSNFSLDPRYDWSGNKQTLIGYEMQTQVTVTDIPMDQVGAMLSQGVGSGANEIYSVSYFSSSYDEAYEEALKKAVELAKTKAQALAEASGSQVGEVLQIEEYNDRQAGRYVDANFSARKEMTEETAAASGSMDMGIMPGEMQVTASITVDFRLISAE